MPGRQSPYSGREQDPYSGHRFWVEIKGLTEVEFTECSGLQAEIEVQEVKEGGVEQVHRLPGRLKTAPNLVLKRGIASAELWDWFNATVTAAQAPGEKFRRENLSIILEGREGLDTIRWDITGALPIKWVGPTLRSGNSEVAFETIEFIHQGINRVRA